MRAQVRNNAWLQYEQNLSEVNYIYQCNDAVSFMVRKIPHMTVV